MKSHARNGTSFHVGPPSGHCASSFAALGNATHLTVAQVVSPVKNAVSVNIAHDSVFLRDVAVELGVPQASMQHFMLFFNGSTNSWRANVKQLIPPGSQSPTVTVVMEDGYPRTFTRYANNLYRAAPLGVQDGEAVLEYLPKQTFPWVLSNPDSKLQDVFDSHGDLRQVVDTTGMVTEFSHAADEEKGFPKGLRLRRVRAAGVSFSLRLGPNKRVQLVQHQDDDTEVIHSYEFDGDGRLTASFAEGISTPLCRYRYDGASGVLLRVAYPGGNGVSFSYNNSGTRRVNRVEWGGTDQVITTDIRHFEFKELTVTRISTPGETSDILWDNKHCRVLRTSHYAHAIPLDRAPPSTTTPLASLAVSTLFEYSNQGRLIKRTNCDGTIDQWKYGGPQQCLSHFIQPTKTILTYYCREPRLTPLVETIVESVRVSSSLTSKSQLLVRRHVYDTNYKITLPSKMRDPQLPSRLQPRYFLRFMISPMGTVTEMEPTARGLTSQKRVYQCERFSMPMDPKVAPDLQTMEEWAGPRRAGKVQLTEYGYDARGLVENQRSYSSVDANGNGVHTPDVHLVQQGYDSRANLVSKSIARSHDGSEAASTTQWEFDERQRVTTHLDALRHKQTFTYNDSMRSVTIAYPSGRVDTTTKSDTLRRIHSSSAVGSDVRTSSSVLDVAGRVGLHRNKDNNIEYYTYTWLGRREYSVSPNYQLTRSVYNDFTKVHVTSTYYNRISRNGLFFGQPPSSPDEIPSSESIQYYLPQKHELDRHKLSTRDVHDKIAVTIGTGMQVEHRIRNPLGHRVATVKYKAGATPQEWQKLSTYGGVLSRTPNPATDEVTLTCYNLDADVVAHVDAAGYVAELILDATGSPVASIRYSTPLTSVQVSKLLVKLTTGTYADPLQGFRPARVPNKDSVEFFLRDGLGRVIRHVQNQVATVTTYAPFGKPLVRTTLTTRVSSWWTKALASDPCTLAVSDLDKCLFRAREDRIQVMTYDQMLRQASVTHMVYATPIADDAKEPWLTCTWKLKRDLAIQQQFDVDGHLVCRTSADCRANLYPSALTDHARSERWKYDAWGQLVAHCPPMVSTLIDAIQTSGDSPAEKSKKIAAVWKNCATIPEYTSTGLHVSTSEVGTGSTRRRTVLYSDKFHRPIIEVHPNGGVTRRTLSPFGQETKHEESVKKLTALQVASLSGGFLTSSSDINHLLASVMAGAITITRTFDVSGNKKSETIDGFTTLFKHSPWGHLVSQTLPVTVDGKQVVTVEHKYNTRDQRVETKRIGTDGKLTIVFSWEYKNHFGHLSKQVDGNGHAMLFEYDADGHQTVVRRGDTHAILEQYQVDALGRRTSQTNGAQETTAFVYNRQQRTKLKQPPITGTGTLFAYSLFGETVRKTRGAQLSEATPKYQAFQHNAMGKVTLSVNEVGARVVDTFYLTGWHETHVDPDGVVTYKQYDASGHKIAETFNFKDDEKTEATNGTITSNSVNQTTTWEVDGMGRETKKTDPKGVVTTYELNDRGLVKQRVDDAGGIDLTTTMSFDGLGNKTFTTIGHGGASASNTAPGGPTLHRIKFTYDTLGRESSKIEDPTPAADDGLEHKGTSPTSHLNITSSQKLDKMSQVVRATDKEGAHDYTWWDPVGNKRFHVRPNGGVTEWRYDAANRVHLQIDYSKAITVHTNYTLADVEALVKKIVTPNDGKTWVIRDKNGREAFRGVLILMPSSTSNIDCEHEAIEDDEHKASGPPPGVASAPSLTSAVAVSQLTYDNNSKGICEVAYTNTITVSEMQTATFDTMTTLMASKAKPSEDRATYTMRDASDRAVLHIDSEGCVSQLVYTPSARIAARIKYASPVTSPSTFAALPLSTALSRLSALKQSSDERRYTFFDVTGSPSAQVMSINGTQGAATVYAHNLHGKLITSCKFASPVTLPTAYDDLSTLAKTVSALKPSRANGNRMKTTTYDNLGHSLTATDAKGKSETYTRNVFGLITSHIDRRGKTWEFSYDAVQRLQLKSQPSALVSTSTEETDEKHNVVNIGIPTPARRQVKTFYRYDKNGNATQIIKDYQGVDERTFNCTYDSRKKLVRMWLDNVELDNKKANASMSVRPTIKKTQATVYSWDARHLKVAVEQPNSLIEFRVYDSARRLQFRVRSDGAVVQFLRNAFGEVVKSIMYANKVSLPFATYKSTGIPLSVISAAIKPNASQDRWVLYARNRRGQPTEEQRGPSIQAYNPKTHKVAPGVRHTKFQYDALGHVRVTSRLQYADSKVWAHDYSWRDARHHVIAKATAVGVSSTQAMKYKATTYTVNTFGERVGTRNYATALSASPAAWTYSQLQHVLASLRNAKDRVNTCTFDANGWQQDKSIEQAVVQRVTTSGGQTRLVTTTTTLTTTYTRDEVGHVIATTEPDGTVHKSVYDERSQLVAHYGPTVHGWEMKVGTGSNPGTASSTSVIPLTRYFKNAHNQDVGRTKYVQGAKSTSDPTPKSPNSSQDESHTLKYDSRGLPSWTSTGAGRLEGFTHNFAKKVVRRYQKRPDPAVTAGHIDEVRFGLNLANQPESTEYWRDGTRDNYKSNLQTYNVFGDTLSAGRFVDSASLPEYRRVDSQGHDWLTNAGNGSPMLQLTDLFGKVTATLQASAKDISSIAYTTQALQSLANLGSTDYTNVERTTMERDPSRAGHVLERILPAMQPSPVAGPETTYVQMLFSTQLSAFGAYSLSWPVPHINSVGQFFIKPTAAEDKPENWRTLIVKVHDDRWGVDVSALATDQYTYRLLLYLPNPSSPTKLDTNQPLQNEATGIVEIVTAQAASGHIPVPVITMNGTKLELAGASSGVTHVQLWTYPPSGSAVLTKTLALTADPTSHRPAVVLTGQQLPSGYYTAVPVKASGPVTAWKSQPFAVYTYTAPKQPVSRIIDVDQCYLSTLKQWGQLTVWSHLPQFLEHQSVRLTVLYKDSSGHTQALQQAVIKPTDDHGTHTDSNGDSLRCNVQFPHEVLSVANISLDVAWPVNTSGSAQPTWVPLYNATPPTVPPPHVQHHTNCFLFRHKGAGNCRDWTLGHPDPQVRQTAAPMLRAVAETKALDDDDEKERTGAQWLSQDGWHWVECPTSSASKAMTPSTSHEDVPNVIQHNTFAPRTLAYVDALANAHKDETVRLYNVNMDVQASWTKYSLEGVTSTGFVVQVSSLAGGIYPLTMQTQASTPSLSSSAPQTVTHRGFLWVPQGGRVFSSLPWPGLTAHTLKSRPVSHKAMASSDDAKAIVRRETYVRSVFGDILQQTDAMNNVRNMTYNHHGKVLTSTSPYVWVQDANKTKHRVRLVTTNGYNARGDHIARVNPLGQVEWWVLDEAGKKTSHYLAGDSFPIKRSARNACGREVAYMDARGQMWQREYDADGINSALVAPPNDANNARRRTTYTYHTRQERTSQTDPEGRRTVYVYDVAGNIGKTIDPAQSATVYERNVKGKLMAKDNAHNWGHRSKPPHGNTTTPVSLWWDLDYWGNPLQHKDLGGAIYTYAYDHKKQMTRQSCTAGTHGKQQKLYTINVPVLVEFGWRITRFTVPVQRQGPVETTPGQDLQMKYTAGMVCEILDNPNKTKTFIQNDANGRRIKAVLERYGYENATENSSQEYDALGRITRVYDRGMVENITYDEDDNRRQVEIHISCPISHSTLGLSMWNTYGAGSRVIYSDCQMVNGQIVLRPGSGRQYEYSAGFRTHETFLSDTGSSQYNAMAYFPDGSLREVSSDVADNNKSYTYWANGQQKTCTDHTGTTTTTYSSNGAPSVVNAPKSNTTFAYYPGSSVVQSQHTTQSGNVSFTLTNSQTLFDSPQLCSVSGHTHDKYGDKNGSTAMKLYDCNGMTQCKLGDTSKYYKYSGAPPPHANDNVQPHTTVFKGTSDNLIRQRIYVPPIDFTLLASFGFLHSYAGENAQFFYNLNNEYVASYSSLPWVQGANNVFGHWQYEQYGLMGRPIVTPSSGGSIYSRNTVNIEAAVAYDAFACMMGPGGSLLQSTDAALAHMLEGGQFVQSITNSQLAATPQKYVVRAGDTFASISKSVFGTTSAAASIASANDYGSPQVVPTPGQVLNIRPFIAKQNKSQDATPYTQFVSRIVGNLMPHLSWAQPHHSCWKEVVEVVICAVVAYFAPYLAPEIFGAVLGSSFVAVAVTAALMDAAIQGLCVGLGVLQKFNWEDVLESAVSAGMGNLLKGVTFGLQQKWLIAVIKCGINNVVHQLADMACGFQRSFNLKSVISSMMLNVIDAHIPTIPTPNVLLTDAVNDVVDSFVNGMFSSAIMGAPMDIDQMMQGALDSFAKQVATMAAADAKAEFDSSTQHQQQPVTGYQGVAPDTHLHAPVVIVDPGYAACVADSHGLAGFSMQNYVGSSGTLPTQGLSATHSQWDSAPMGSAPTVAPEHTPVPDDVFPNSVGTGTAAEGPWLPDPKTQPDAVQRQVYLTNNSLRVQPSATPPPATHVVRVHHWYSWSSLKADVDGGLHYVKGKAEALGHKAEEAGHWTEHFVTKEYHKGIQDVKSEYHAARAAVKHDWHELRTHPMHALKAVGLWAAHEGIDLTADAIGDAITGGVSLLVPEGGEAAADVLGDAVSGALKYVGNAAFGGHITLKGTLKAATVSAVHSLGFKVIKKILVKTGVARYVRRKLIPRVVRKAHAYLGRKISHAEFAATHKIMHSGPMKRLTRAMPHAYRRVMHGLTLGKVSKKYANIHSSRTAVHKIRSFARQRVLHNLQHISDIPTDKLMDHVNEPVDDHIGKVLFGDDKPEAETDDTVSPARPIILHFPGASLSARFHDWCDHVQAAHKGMNETIHYHATLPGQDGHLTVMEGVCAPHHQWFQAYDMHISLDQ